MIVRRVTGVDRDGVRHLVFILSGFPIGSTSCGRKQAIRREHLDENYEAITCAECLVFENERKHGRR